MKLDQRDIRAALDAASPVHGPACRLALLDEVDSTNRWLQQNACADVEPTSEAERGDGPIAHVPGGCGPCACIAERQSAGRGRRGRDWLSGDDGLTLSVSRHFARSPLQLGGLSLAVGVALAAALEQLGAGRLALKWPNDLLWQERKLGGILIELVGARQDDCSAITGVGINYRHSPQLEQPVASLAEAFDGPPPPRSQLAGQLIGALLDAFARFEAEGFAPFRDAWAARDLFAGREVNVQAGHEWRAGRALGVAGDGALRIEIDGREERFNAGEVSLRLAP